MGFKHRKMDDRRREASWKGGNGQIAARNRLSALMEALDPMSALPPKADIDGDSLLLLASTGDPLRQGFPVRVVLRGKLPAAGVEGIAARLGSEWL